MESKKSIHTTEEQLHEARKRGLKQAAEVHAMKAHGKVLGLDTFSWIRPQVDLLATVLVSFPFPVFWVCSKTQAEALFHLYPEVSESVIGLIVYDDAEMTFDPAVIHQIPRVICFNGLSESLRLLSSIQKEKNILLFTTEGPNREDFYQTFSQFIEHNQ